MTAVPVITIKPGFRVVMENPGGELDSRDVLDGRGAALAIVQMIEECGELADGDVFRVEEIPA